MITFDAPKTIGQFMGSDAFVRMVMGPVGSGKSSGCCIEIIRRTIEMPPTPFSYVHVEGELDRSEEEPSPQDIYSGIRRSRWCIVRNTYVELRDTTIKTFREWIPDPNFGTWKQSEHTFLLDFETDMGARVQAEIMFRALDKPDDVKKLKSLELTGCYFNETKEIPKPIFDMMQNRVGRYPRKSAISRYWTGIIGDTNPCDEDHWIYKTFEEARPEGFSIYKQPSGIKPRVPGQREVIEYSPDAENVKHLDRCWDVESHLRGEARKLAQREQELLLSEGEHESPCRCYYVRQCAGKDADYIKVYVRGEYGFVKEGKPIYPEFQDAIHVVDYIPLLPGCKELVVGNDYGITPAAVFGQQDPQDGQWQIIREFLCENEETMGAIRFGEEQALICKRDYKTVKVIRGWGDPAGMAQSQTDEKTPISCVNAAGMPMVAAPTNDFTLRREAVAGLLTRLTILGRPAIVISSACKTLRKAMAGGYHYRRLKVAGDEKFEDKPDKNMYSHVAEALQYLAVGEGEDRRALDGGKARKPQRVEVIRSSGVIQAPRGYRYDGEDEDDLPRGPVRIIRSH